MFSDLLLLQDVIRAPLFAEHGYSVYVRQLRDADMRETLKALDKKGVKNYIAHLDTQRTLKLLKAVSDDVTSQQLHAHAYRIACTCSAQRLWSSSSESLISGLGSVIRGAGFRLWSLACFPTVVPGLG